MPVIIDDFEILIAPPPTPSPSASEDETAQPPRPLTPRDIQDVIDAMHEREARLRAD
nr:hypothetical protein [Ardenticatena sp.]